jgi:hypothetical protein
MVGQASNIARSKRKTYLQIDDCRIKTAYTPRQMRGRR